MLKQINDKVSPLSYDPMSLHPALKGHGPAGVIPEDGHQDN